MAARQMFGTRDFAWPVTNVTQATSAHVSTFMITPTGVDKKKTRSERKEIAKLIISDI